ncbi:hypothetical protein M3J09_003850 [Ascochyta lentis]
MSRVYSKTWRVIVCIKDFAADQCGRYQRYSDYTRLFYRLQRDDTGRSILCELASFHTLDHLVYLRYFQRVWVI